MKSKKIIPIPTQKAKYENLEDLFADWRAAHCAEENYEETTVVEEKNAKGVIYPGIEKDSFVKDGYICREEYQNAEKKILFILKEANIQAYRSEYDFKNPSKRQQIYFYRNYIEDKSVLNRPKQQEKIAVISQYILNGKKEFSSDSAEDRRILQKVSFMNLNKRGGDNIEKKVKAYCEKYIKYINAQISILNPDIVVVIGKTINISKLETGSAKVIRLNHTADLFHGTYRVDAYLSHFIREYEK